MAPTTVSELYGWFTLDIVIEAARAVANDAIDRPHRYGAVDAAILKTLSNFRYKVGTDGDWMDAEQRSRVCRKFFGPPGGPDDLAADFVSAMNTVHRTATSYSERVNDTGEEMLRTAFTSACTAMEVVLSLMKGNGATLTESQVKALLQNANDVLADAGVAGVFGASAAPVKGANWPHNGDYNGAAAHLIAEISRSLPMTTGVTSAQRFVDLQRVAKFGADTIAGIQDDKHKGADAVVKALIVNAYNWAVALRSTTSSATAETAPGGTRTPAMSPVTRAGAASPAVPLTRAADAARGEAMRALRAR